ncbi:MAG: hypothetical protein ACJAT4_002638 [Granulosicoccus sp.]
MRKRNNILATDVAEQIIQGWEFDTKVENFALKGSKILVKKKAIHKVCQNLNTSLKSLS